MANRTTHNKVKEIFDTNINDLVPFITAANVMINNQLSAEITAGDISAATLIEMERWLAAHFACAYDPAVTQEKLGEATVQYQGYYGKGLESTSFGQRALALDSTGKLSAGGKRSSVFTAVDFLT